MERPIQIGVGGPDPARDVGAAERRVRVDVDAPDDLVAVRRQDRVGEPRRAAKSAAWRSRSARFSSRVIGCGQPRSKPGVAAMWAMLEVQAA